MSWKTFVESLTAGIPHSDTRFRGIKIATLGFLIALCGLFIFLGSFEQVGKPIIYLGIAVGFIGATIHVATMLRKKSKRGRRD